MNFKEKKKLFTQYYAIEEKTVNVVQWRRADPLSILDLDNLIPDGPNALYGELYELNYQNTESEYYNAEESYEILFKKDTPNAHVLTIYDAYELQAFIEDRMLDDLSSRGIDPNINA